jgi:hypothetical protein
VVVTFGGGVIPHQITNRKGNKKVSHSFGELIELVKNVSPEYDNEKARSYLAGLLFSIADDSAINRVAVTLKKYGTETANQEIG